MVTRSGSVNSSGWDNRCPRPPSSTRSCSCGRRGRCPTRTGYSRIWVASARLPGFRYAFHLNRSTFVVRCRPSMKSSEMRAGPWVSRLMLIQKASDSISPPLLAVDPHSHLTPAVRGTRAPAAQSQHVLEFDRPDRSIIVRRTIHSGWVSSKPISRRWSWPMSWMCLYAESNRSRPIAIDVGDPQRPLPVEHVGVRVGHGHHHLRQTGAACHEARSCHSP